MGTTELTNVDLGFCVTISGTRLLGFTVVLLWDAITGATMIRRLVFATVGSIPGVILVVIFIRVGLNRILQHIGYGLPMIPLLLGNLVTGW